MACKQFRSEPCVTYDAEYVSFVLALPSYNSAPEDLLRSDALCTCDSEDVDWSYSEECSFRSRLTN